MKTLILGASNEIIQKGYVYSLGYANLINASTGGCCITAGVANYLKHNQPDAELALLNFELNEHGIIKNGLRTEKEAHDLWCWLIFKLRQKGTQPVIIVLPRLLNGKITRTSTCDFHKHISQLYNIPFIDVAEVFLSAVEHGADLSKLMKDNAHMTDTASRILGQHLRHYFDDFSISFCRDEIFQIEVCDFQLIDSSSFLPKSSQVSRKTSLASAILSTHKEGDVFSIKSDPNDELIALIVNRLSHPGASLVFNSTTKGIYFDNAQPEHYMSVVIDIKGGVYFQDDKIDFHVKPCNLVATEKTWLSKAPEIQSDVTGYLEIESALIKKSRNINISYFGYNTNWHCASFADTEHFDAIKSSLCEMAR